MDVAIYVSQILVVTNVHVEPAFIWGKIYNKTCEYSKSFVFQAYCP